MVMSGVHTLLDGDDCEDFGVPALGSRTRSGLQCPGEQNVILKVNMLMQRLLQRLKALP